MDVRLPAGLHRLEGFVSGRRPDPALRRGRLSLLAHKRARRRSGSTVSIAEGADEKPANQKGHSRGGDGLEARNGEQTIQKPLPEARTLGPDFAHDAAGELVEETGRGNLVLLEREEATQRIKLIRIILHRSLQVIGQPGLQLLARVKQSRSNRSDIALHDPRDFLVRQTLNIVQRHHQSVGF